MTRYWVTELNFSTSIFPGDIYVCKPIFVAITWEIYRKTYIIYLLIANGSRNPLFLMHFMLEMTMNHKLFYYNWETLTCIKKTFFLHFPLQQSSLKSIFFFCYSYGYVAFSRRVCRKIIKMAQRANKIECNFEKPFNLSLTEKWYERLQHCWWI